MSDEATSPAAPLANCPFCGAAHDDDRDGPVLRTSDEGRQYVFCNNCGASGPEHVFFPGDAIAAWNRRSDVSPPSAPGPLLVFSLAFIDGYMEGENEEARRHWKRVREAAVGAKETP